MSKSIILSDHFWATFKDIWRFFLVTLLCTNEWLDNNGCDLIIITEHTYRTSSVTHSNIALNVQSWSSGEPVKSKSNNFRLSALAAGHTWPSGPFWHKQIDVCWATAIAPWFCLRLPSCDPGFKSLAHQLGFFNLYCWNCNLNEKRTKINEREAGFGPKPTKHKSPPINTRLRLSVRILLGNFIIVAKITWKSSCGRRWASRTWCWPCPRCLGTCWWACRRPDTRDGRSVGSSCWRRYERSNR